MALGPMRVPLEVHQQIVEEMTRRDRINFEENGLAVAEEALAAGDGDYIDDSEDEEE